MKDGQEYLNVVADGFPGVIHLDCYDAWYDSHIRWWLSDSTYYLSCWMTMAQIEQMIERKVMFKDFR